jgi:hypothetical protein
MALSALNLSLRIGCTKVPGKKLHYAQGEGGRRGKNGRMRRPPARSGGKRFYALDSLCFEAEEEQWYNRTAQSHPKSSKNTEP